MFVISLNLDPNPCDLPKQPGNCMALNYSYYYNKATNECEQFIYGGCHGNANRFNTKEECEKKCKC